MRLRLKTKITLIIALLVLTVVGVTSWLHVLTLTRQVIQQADGRANLVAQQVFFQAQNALADAAAEGRWDTGGPGHTIKAEFNDRSHQRGVISMARSQHPDSAGSQFFICDGDASFLDRQYTAFGKLIQGDDVLAKIAATPVSSGGSGEKSKPQKRVGVISIKIVPAAA